MPAGVPVGKSPASPLSTLSRSATVIFAAAARAAPARAHVLDRDAQPRELLVSAARSKSFERCSSCALESRHRCSMPSCPRSPWRAARVDRRSCGSAPPAAAGSRARPRAPPPGFASSRPAWPTRPPDRWLRPAGGARCGRGAGQTTGGAKGRRCARAPAARDQRRPCGVGGCLRRQWTTTAIDDDESAACERSCCRARRGSFEAAAAGRAAVFGGAASSRARPGWTSILENEHAHAGELTRAFAETIRFIKIHQRNRAQLYGINPAQGQAAPWPTKRRKTTRMRASSLVSTTPSSPARPTAAPTRCCSAPGTTRRATP